MPLCRRVGMVDDHTVDCFRHADLKFKVNRSRNPHDLSLRFHPFIPESLFWRSLTPTFDLLAV